MTDGIRSLWMPLTGLLCVFLALALSALGEGDAARLARSAPFLSPGAGAWLGTNAIGQDIFWRMLAGGRHTLCVALPAAGAALALGALLGTGAGLLQGPLDAFARWLANAIDALPFYLWSAVIVVALAPAVLAAPVAIAAVFWTTTFRVVRAEVLTLRSAAFVESALLLGVPPWGIVTRHLLPAVRHLLLTQAGLLLASAVKVEVTLSFLGLTGSDSVSWGTMLAEAARDLVRGHPWNAIAAGGALWMLLYLLTRVTDTLQQRFTERSEAESAR